MPNPEGKIKFPLWIYPTTHQLVKNNYRKDNCRTMSQFIEKAIQYYVGKINAEDDTSYLPNAFLSNLKNVVMESEKRQKRELEFLAIEIALIETIMAATNGVSKETVDRLRGDCEKMLRKYHGRLKYEHIADWQNGDN